MLPAYTTSYIASPQQTRHPERSAPQIYRVTQRLVARSRRACPELSRGNPEGAYPTHAVRTFSTTEARTWRARHDLSLGPKQGLLASLVSAHVRGFPAPGTTNSRACGFH